MTMLPRQSNSALTLWSEPWCFDCFDCDREWWEDVPAGDDPGSELDCRHCGGEGAVVTARWSTGRAAQHA